jgi:hypothetical protein
MVVIAVDGKIHAIGGRLSSPIDRTNEHDIYDSMTDKWAPGPPLPTPRSGLASANYHGLILVLGGELPPDHTFPENEAFDPKNNRWTSLAPAPHGRHGFGGDVIGDDAFFVGGSLTPGDRGATGQLLMFAFAVHLLNKPMISAFARVLKCKLKPTTAADVSAFTSNLSVFTANTVKR